METLVELLERGWEREAHSRAAALIQTVGEDVIQALGVVEAGAILIAHLALDDPDPEDAFRDFMAMHAQIAWGVFDRARKAPQVQPS